MQKLKVFRQSAAPAKYIYTRICVGGTHVYVLNKKYLRLYNILLHRINKELIKLQGAQTDL